MGTTRIASICMKVDPRDKKANLDKMLRFIEEAGAEGVDLLVFPELALTGVGTVGMQRFSPDDRAYMVEVAELIPEGETVHIIAEQAKRYGMYIVWGMVERDPDRFDITYNDAVLVGPEGYMGKYRKVHLPVCERLVHHAGSGDYPVFDTRIGKIGLMVCYDKAFPEVARELALRGAEVMCCPTCWPNRSRSDDDPDFITYKTFSFARAMENTVFHVDSNQTNAVIGGHSQIVGPNPGQLIASTGFDEGMAIADVDIRAEILHARIHAMAGSDLLRDRKPGTYTAIAGFDPFGLNYGACAFPETVRPFTTPVK